MRRRRRRPSITIESNALDKIPEILSEHNILCQNGLVNTRAIISLLWKLRKSPTLAEPFLSLLGKEVHCKSVFESIEYYLPQLVHLAVHCESSIKDRSCFESFLLVVSQQSIHSGLRIMWTLVGKIQDYQPELRSGKTNPNKNTNAFVRAVGLLNSIESVIVFPGPGSVQLERLFMNEQVDKREYVVLNTADRRFRASEIVETAGKQGSVLKRSTVLQEVLF